MNKKELRQIMILNRKKLGKEIIWQKSKKIQFNLYSLNEYKKSNFIFTFVSTEYEVDTHNIIRHSIKNKKRIGVPITLPKEKKLLVSEIYNFDEELEIGYYNILTPKKEFIRVVSPDIIDLVLVPGLIFSKKGYRIGFGGGYYDRFLKDVNVIKIGLCFNMQLKDEFPISEHDIPVDIIVTEDKIINCKENRE